MEQDPSLGTRCSPVLGPCKDVKRQLGLFHYAILSLNFGLKTQKARDSDNFSCLPSTPIVTTICNISKGVPQLSSGTHVMVKARPLVRPTSGPSGGWDRWDSLRAYVW